MARAIKQDRQIEKEGEKKKEENHNEIAIHIN